MSVTLTKEQAAILLPLLPNLAGLVTAAQPEETAKGGEEPSYSISEMFEKKKKNSRSTIAQNYLLAIVRTSAKAANIWEDPPLLRNLTAAQLGKFFDTAFLMCPKLKSYRQQLTTRLSRTLINRRLFVNRLRRKGLLLPKGQPSANKQCVRETTTIFDNHTTSEEASTSKEVLTIDSDPELPLQTHQTLTSKAIEHHSSNCRLISGHTVIVVKADSSPIGRGIFLKMNSEEPFEQFAKVLFLSSKKGTVLDAELPLMSEHGKLNFKELKQGDIFAWKVSRLLPDVPDNKSTPKNRKKDVIITDDGSGDSDEESSTDLSPYELKRLENIARNKRKLEEIFGTETKLKAKRAKKKKSDDVNENAKQFKKRPEVPTINEPHHTYTVGEYVAVRCEKFSERPLIGHITQIDDKTVNINWMIGSYSGIWKEWKGRSEGKYITFADTIPLEDVMTPIELTKGMRLPQKTVSTLKELYV